MIRSLIKKSPVDSRLVAALLLAVIVRIAYLWMYAGLPDWSYLTVDNYYHHHWAQSIADGNILGDTTYFRAPLYAWVLGALYAALGSSLWIGRVFGSLVGLASVAATYSLGRRVFSRKVALAAALIHAVFPTLLYFEAELLLDPMFTLLLQLTLLAVLDWRQTGRLRSARWTGLILGLTAITRPTALVLTPLLAAAALWGGAARRTSRHLVRFAGGLTLVVGIVFLRNLLLAGDPVLISSQGGINFYIGNHEGADGLSSHLPEPLGYNWTISQTTAIAEQDRGRSLTPGEVSGYWMGQTLAWIASDPISFAALYARKLYFAVGTRELSNNRHLGSFYRRIPLLRYNPLTFALLLGFAAAGTVAGWRRHPGVRLLSSTVVLYLLTVALFFVASRFRLPVLPVLILLACAGAAEVITAVARRLTSGLGLVAVVAAVWFLSWYPIVAMPSGPGVTALGSLGLHLYSQNRIEDAKRYFEAARAADSTYPEINLNLAACHMRAGHLDSARTLLEREKRFNPQRYRTYINLASWHLLRGSADSARFEAASALRLAPWDVLANRALLRSLEADSLLPADSLSAEIERAANRTRDNIYVLLEGASLLTAHRAWPQAEAVLRRALATTPPPIETDDAAFTADFPNSRTAWRRQKAKAHHLLGYVAGIQNNLGEAVRQNRRALQIDPDLAVAYVNLVSALRLIGQTAEADSVAARARLRLPRHPLIEKLR